MLNQILGSALPSDLLVRWAHRSALPIIVGNTVPGSPIGCRGTDTYCVGCSEADQGLRGNLDLLSAGDGVGASPETTSGGGPNGGALATAEDAAKDGADSGSTTDLGGCVLAATVAFLAEGFARDGDGLTPTGDGGELDREERVALEVGGLLDGADPAADWRSLRNGDETVDNNVISDGSVEGVTLLRGGAIESLRDADGERSP